MKLKMISLALIVAACAEAEGPVITEPSKIEWDHLTASEFRVYLGNTPGVVPNSSPHAVVNTKEWPIDVGPGQWYFIVTAYDSATSQESAKSAEMPFVIPAAQPDPPDPPTNIRLAPVASDPDPNPPAPECDFYVRNGGNNANDGTSDAQAWATLTFASSQLSNGDTLCLRRGDTWTGAGAGTAPLLLFDGIDNVTVTAYGSGALPLLDRSAESGNGSSLNPDRTCVRFDVADNNVVEYIECIAAANTAAVLFYEGTGNAIRYSNISGEGWAESLIVGHEPNVVGPGNFVDAITGNSSGYGGFVEFRYENGPLITGNVFRGYGSNGGVRCSNFAACTIENNFIYEPDPRNGPWCWAIVVRQQDDGVSILRNNVISLVGSGGSCTGSDLEGMAFWGDEGNATRKIINNTFVGDGDGVAILGSSSVAVVADNIFYDVAQGWEINDSGQEWSHTLTNNCFFSVPTHYEDGVPNESGTFTSNPNLSNPLMSNDVAADAKPVSPSPAINGASGQDQHTPTMDIAGAVRPGGSSNDVGAFEVN